MAELVYQVTAPHFCAAFIAHNGRVTRAADILGWTRGKRTSVVLKYLNRKGWHYIVWVAGRPPGHQIR